MTIRTRHAATFALCVGLLLASAVAADALAPESKRLTRARDLIGEEQWLPAIEQLKAAVADPKETRRDEALFWLAHSQYHSGDPASAVATVSRLEREHPKSMWVRNAQSLRIEIAVRLQRRDVLWWTAMPPPPPAVPIAARPSGKPGPRAPNASPPDPAAPTQVLMPPAYAPAPAKAPPPDKSAATAAPKPGPAFPPPPADMWLADPFSPDAELQVLALRGLMRLDDAEKVVPILGKIALEGDPGPAMRAVFTLAQSPSPKAIQTVVRVAKDGKEPVKIAAVRDLGRFGGPEISKELLAVYATASPPVKRQIVNTFGERAEQGALFYIVNAEKDGELRYRAITKLGQAGGVAQLAGLYKSARSPESKRSIIGGLFIAHAVDQLIFIADAERTAGNDALCGAAIEHLRLLNTPSAKEYLQKVAKKR